LFDRVYDLAKTFVVNSDIPSSMKTNVSAWLLGTPKLLSEKGIRDVKFKNAYCCTPDMKIITEFEGPDKEAVTKALQKIELPFTAVMEATVLRPDPEEKGDRLPPYGHWHRSDRPDIKPSSN
jgi:hypothetical protein